jgi:hypothetical protein
MRHPLNFKGVAQIVANRFPVKHFWDGMAVTKILLKGSPYDSNPIRLSQRLRCLKFYLDSGDVSRLHAALPRSGQSWAELSMTLALDLSEGGDGEYTYEDGIFFPSKGLAYRRFDWRVPLGDVKKMYAREQGPALGKIYYFHSRNAYFRIRSASLKKMRIVVQVRSILDSLESRFVKFSNASHLSDVSITDEDSFDWNAATSRSIEFYNSWGDVLGWHPSALLVRYEDLKREPVAGLREMLDFWGFNVRDEYIREALRRAERNEMLTHIPADQRDGNAEAGNRQATQRGILSVTRRRKIIEQLNSGLIHSLGYNYAEDMEYGHDFNKSDMSTRV